MLSGGHRFSDISDTMEGARFILCRCGLVRAHRLRAGYEVVWARGRSAEPPCTSVTVLLLHQEMCVGS